MCGWVLISFSASFSWVYSDAVFKFLVDSVKQSLALCGGREPLLYLLVVSVSSRELCTDLSPPPQELPELFVPALLLWSLFWGFYSVSFSIPATVLDGPFWCYPPCLVLQGFLGPHSRSCPSLWHHCLWSLLFQKHKTVLINKHVVISGKKNNVEWTNISYFVNCLLFWLFEGSSTQLPNK